MAGYKYKGSYTGPDLFDATATTTPNRQPGKQPCGTYAAYRRHLYNKEEVCQPCENARQQRNSRKRTPSPRQLHPCGTPAAYQRHKRRGEDPCDPCTLAGQTYWHNQRKKAAA